jgi:hypothetical protein
LARECGWTHEWIGNNLTEKQIYRYYESLQELILSEVKTETISRIYAFGFVQGSIKKEALQEYLDILSREKKKREVDYDKLRSLGVLEEK